jgi:2-C-methyl-D-erythritol 2,4-cyclodiphosphate synthase
MKIGIGYDSHGLVKNRPLVLGGVTIPFPLGLAGHSDADVLTHAVMDALLGAAGLPDIGNLFPASDPKYKNISSLKLLAVVAGKLKKKKLVNLDAVILCDAPPLNIHLPQMKKNIAQVLQCRPAQIGLKAKHADGLTHLKNKFIQATCVCLLK